MTEIDKLAWLCIREKQILTARSKGKNIYYIPGGKREKGESDQAALIREIKEELSIDLIPATIKYAGTFKANAHEKPEGVQVKVTCYYAEFTGKIQSDAEIEEVKWLNYADKMQCSPVTIMIMEKLKLDGLL